MTLCIGLVDLRIASSHSAASVAAWRAARHRLWLTRCRATLTTDAGENQATIVSRLRTAISTHRRGAEAVELDVVCHGSAAAYEGPVTPGPVSEVAGMSAIAFSWLIGSGLQASNVHFWAPLAKVFRRVRMYACGERNPVLAQRSYPQSVARESLCRQFADVLNAEVVSCPETVVFGVAEDPDSYRFSVGSRSFNPFDTNAITVHGWEGSTPVTVFLAGGRTRALPRGDRLGR